MTNIERTGYLANAEVELRLRSLETCARYNRVKNAILIKDVLVDLYIQFSNGCFDAEDEQTLYDAAQRAVVVVARMTVGNLEPVYNRDLDDSGLSGDDVNRRLRERRMGYESPSDDWEELKGTVIRCIYPGQVIRRRPDENDVFMNQPAGMEVI